MARLTWLLFIAHAVHAQPATDQLRFEVASLKPSGPKSVRGWEGGPGTSDPQLYTFGWVTLVDLVCAAYELRSFQVSSKLALDKDEFDLAARMPAETTKLQFRSMMQNLLADRFHLKFHRISKDFSAYALVVGKGGPKFQASGARDSRPSPRSGDGFPEVATNRPDIRSSLSGRGTVLIRINAHQEPISALVLTLPVPDNQPVVDQTGLTGTYDFRLGYSLDRGADTDGPPLLPDLFSAIQQQLGLQLVHKKVPFDVLVIDQVDRYPTEN